MPPVLGTPYSVFRIRIRNPPVSHPINVSTRHQVERKEKRLTREKTSPPNGSETRMMAFESADPVQVILDVPLLVKNTHSG